MTPHALLKELRSIQRLAPRMDEKTFRMWVADVFYQAEPLGETYQPTGLETFDEYVFRVAEEVSAIADEEE